MRSGRARQTLGFAVRFEVLPDLLAGAEIRHRERIGFRCSRRLKGFFRTPFFFLYSLLPFFILCPAAVLLLSCRCLFRCPVCCPAAVLVCLIFVVITDGYNRNACLGVCLNHCLGFQSRNQPLDPALWPVQHIGEVANRHGKLAALKRNWLAFVPYAHRPPRCTQHHPCEGHRFAIIPEGRMPQQRAVDAGVALLAHAKSARKASLGEALLRHASSSHQGLQFCERMQSCTAASSSCQVLGR